MFVEMTDKQEVLSALEFEVEETQYEFEEKHFNPKVLTEDFFREAFFKGLVGMGDIPTKLLTQELAESILMDTYDYIEDFFYKDYSHLDINALCETAVQSCGFAVDLIPLEYLTEDLVKKALRNDPSALIYVPTFHNNLGVLKVAVEGNPHNLRFVPEKFRQLIVYECFIESSMENVV